VFLFDIGALRSSDVLHGVEADTDRYNDEEDGMSSSVVTNDDFARSAGSSVVGIDASTSVAAMMASTERLRRKYNRICALER
jgi:hypothetical protein